MLAVRLPQELEDRLTALSASTGKSKSWYAREAIAEFIADWEDLAIVEQRLADHLAGKSKSWTLEEVERNLGLAD